MEEIDLKEIVDRWTHLEFDVQRQYVSSTSEKPVFCGKCLSEIHFEEDGLCQLLQEKKEIILMPCNSIVEFSCRSSRPRIGNEIHTPGCIVQMLQHNPTRESTQTATVFADWQG